MSTDSSLLDGDGVACRLSEDILSLVFYELLWSRAPHQRCKHPPVLPLSQVSTIWRRAAITHKRLWSYIPMSSPEIAALFLERSKPIDVFVYAPIKRNANKDSHQAALHELMHHSTRIRVLTSWLWDNPFNLWQSLAQYNLAESPALELLGFCLARLNPASIALLSICDN
ncbi:hypothetical protein PENSPDRAFT_756434 [Peniophora sp. CONT]|nr:hypothetical protein PENSPDRAFT_756434 [Peniophora sp. CONT]